MGEQETFRIFHRDILLICALVALGAGLFLFTKKVAAKEQQLDEHVAATWFKQGERKLNSGDVESAIEYFRNATSNDRGNQAYGLALAEALAKGNHRTEAEETLRRLRESYPDSAAVNLQLARLAAESNNVHEAVRYYHDALYGSIAGAGANNERREIRMELVRFLLDHGDQRDAVSELLVLDADLPHTPEAHVQAGELFLRAGDAQHALSDFVEAIRLDPGNAAGRSGAAKAASQLGQYEQARHFLENPASSIRHSPDTFYEFGRRSGDLG